jgi:hypothetical protein
VAPQVILDLAANDAVQFGEHVLVQIGQNGEEKKGAKRGKTLSRPLRHSPLWEANTRGITKAALIEAAGSASH